MGVLSHWFLLSETLVLSTPWAREDPTENIYKKKKKKRLKKEEKGPDLIRSV